MPSFNILKKSNSSKTFRTESIKGIFDLPNTNEISENFQGNLDIENKKWNIGVIVGNSGTGKSSIANEIFNKKIFSFNYSKESVIDDFSEENDLKDILKVLNQVGFSSPISYLKPYHVLSNGEKMRIDIAKAILEESEPIIFDEFTSVVDRNVAKISSLAINKFIRKNNKKFIAVTCHFDVLDWLEPDWVYNTNDGSFFLVEIEKDLKSNWKSPNAIEQNGKIIANIII